MEHLGVYMLWLIAGIAMIVYGRRSRKKWPVICGTVVLFIEIAVPVVAFIFGVMDGAKA